MLYENRGGKLKSKWAENYTGPFVVQEKRNCTSYIVKRLGSDELPRVAHIDNLLASPLLPNVKPIGGTIQDEGEKPATKKKFVVEEILAAMGSGERQKFLVKWEGYEVATWEPIANLDCSTLVKQYHQLTAEEQCKKLCEAGDQYVINNINTASLSSLGAVSRSDSFILLDLSEIDHGDIITHICNKLGIQPSQLLLDWASPPCRTLSRADGSNISRGNHYRDHSFEHHPPRPDQGEKRSLALKHDSLFQSLLHSMQAHVEEDANAQLVIENPTASLARRPFMILAEMYLKLVKHSIHYCAFDAPVRKATDIWTNFEWMPTGTTGDGRCHRRCNKGTFQNGFYGHPAHIGGSAEKYRGGGKIGKSAIPATLHEEILDAAMDASAKGQGSERREYVLDLFAGSASLRDVAASRGLSYIGVDINPTALKKFKEKLLAEKPAGSEIRRA